MQAFDDEIISKWCDELLSSGKDITPKMVGWIVKELQWKAGIFRETGYTVAFDPGVVKADGIIPFELQKELKDAARPLEDVPEEEKDYHPGSDQKVVDLVHPSLFPVIYGRTRILPDQVIRLDDCFSTVGQGQLLPVPPEKQAHLPNDSYCYSAYPGHQGYSRQFQWLPCDIELTPDNGCRIASYVNNLHPQKHRDLYQVIEKILARTIPLWDATLINVNSDYNRIPYHEVEFHEHPDPEPRPANEEEENSDEFWDRHSEWENSTPIKKPEPGEFKPPEVHPYDKVDLREQFAKTGLQVIVKLANIELTPEKRVYEGGSWHVEGQLVSDYFISGLKSHKLTFVERAYLRNRPILLRQREYHGQHSLLPAARPRRHGRCLLSSRATRVFARGLRLSSGC